MKPFPSRIDLLASSVWPVAGNPKPATAAALSSRTPQTNCVPARRISWVSVFVVVVPSLVARASATRDFTDKSTPDLNMILYSALPINVDLIIDTGLSCDRRNLMAFWQEVVRRLTPSTMAVSCSSTSVTFDNVKLTACTAFKSVWIPRVCSVLPSRWKSKVRSDVRDRSMDLETRASLPGFRPSASLGEHMIPRRRGFSANT